MTKDSKKNYRQKGRMNQGRTMKSLLDASKNGPAT